MQLFLVCPVYPVRPVRPPALQIPVPNKIHVLSWFFGCNRLKCANQIAIAKLWQFTLEFVLYGEQNSPMPNWRALLRSTSQGQSILSVYII